MEDALGLLSWRGIEGARNASRKWGWVLALGVALIVLGVFAGSYAMISTIVSVVSLGYIVLIGGVFHVVGAFWMREWSGFFLELLLGVFSVVVGMMLVANPLAAGAGITLMLAIFFMVEGAFRFFGALFHRYSGRGFGILNGLVTFALGLMVYREWPSSALWLLGTFLAIRLLFAGMGMLSLSLVLRKLHRGKI